MTKNNSHFFNKNKKIDYRNIFLESKMSKHFIGNFAENSNEKDLEGFSVSRVISLTIQCCFGICYSQGYHYAGLKM